MGDIIVERTRPVRKPESPSGAHVFTATTGKESHVEVSCVKHHKKKDPLFDTPYDDTR